LRAGAYGYYTAISRIERSADVGVTKLTVNLPDETVQDLREYAENHGITMTEALRRFITRGKYFDDEIQNGGKVLVEKEDKTLREVVLG
jgi:hypothetical protein